MTKNELIKLHQSVCTKMHETIIAKNHDYGGEIDPFYNFKLCERLDVMSTEQGMLARMLDKVSRIASFIKQDALQVKDESIEDTLMDLANYSILLLAYLESKREEKLWT